jgi:hypothetical protein
VIEQIEWHKYPDTNPTKPGTPLYKICLITRMKPGSNFPLCEYRTWEGDKWGKSNELMEITFPDDEFPVVAWAEFPRGWNKDEINTVKAEGTTKDQIVNYANKLRELFIKEGASLDTNSGLCAAWILLKKYFPELVKRFDES